jgi:hypothetical protein
VTRQSFQSQIFDRMAKGPMTNIMQQSSEQKTEDRLFFNVHAEDGIVLQLLDVVNGISINTEGVFEPSMTGTWIDHRNQPQLTHSTQPAKRSGIDDPLHSRGDGHVDLGADSERG